MVVLKDPVQIIIIWETKIIKINVDKDKVTLSLPIKWISKIEKSENMIVFTINDQTGSRSKIKIDVDSKSVIDRVYNQFSQMFK